MRSAVLGVLMAMVVAMVPIAAGEARPGKGPSALADALAVLKINDPRLLDRELTQFAAGLGINPEPLRSVMAGLLFRSRTLEGIDLTRPALMAWRPKEPSLVAVIPLSDRRAFLANFGAGVGGEAPLIRVGEREGTVVYTQNGNDGLVEYRLMVSDRAAYLAGTTALCRELSEFPLQAATNEAPLVFRASAEYLVKLATTAELPPESRQAMQTLAPGVLSTQKAMITGWNAFVAQLAGAELSVRPDAQGAMNFSLGITAKPDSSLAVWITNQRNQPSRLLPIVRSERTVFSLAGNIVWQGQAERLGKIFAPVLQETFGDRWNAMVEENWTSLWAVADRAGPFALASDVELKERTLVGESRYLCDQPKAQEMLSLITLVTQSLTGTVGEAVTAGNATGYREQRPESDQVLVSNERFLVSVQSSPAARRSARRKATAVSCTWG
jgi:hypothetical protein